MFKIKAVLAAAFLFLLSVPSLADEVTVGHYRNAYNQQQDILGVVVLNSNGSDSTHSSSSLAPGVTALSTSATLVLASGSTFVSRIVCNDDQLITEYAGGSDVTSGGAHGVKLIGGVCWDFSHTTAAIYMVAASGTPNARGVQY